MIALLTPERQESLAACISHEPVFGARIDTLLRVYGYDSPIAPIWMALDDRGRATAAMSRFGGCFTVSAGADADWEEIAAFIAMAGETAYIESSREACAHINRVISGRWESSWEMTLFGSEINREADMGTAVKATKLEDVFRILCSADDVLAKTARWETWYPHVSHLLRHALGFCRVVEVSGETCGTGGVYAMSPVYAVLSGIAVLPAYREKGCGGQIIRALAADSLQAGRKPVLCCASDALAAFYEKLGFAVTGRWGRIHLDGKD